MKCSGSHNQFFFFVQGLLVLCSPYTLFNTCLIPNSPMRQQSILFSKSINSKAFSSASSKLRSNQAGLTTMGRDVLQILVVHNLQRLPKYLFSIWFILKNARKPCQAPKPNLLRPANFSLTSPLHLPCFSSRDGDGIC